MPQRSSSSSVAKAKDNAVGSKPKAEQPAKPVEKIEDIEPADPKADVEKVNPQAEVHKQQSVEEVMDTPPPMSQVAGQAPEKLIDVLKKIHPAEIV